MSAGVLDFIGVVGSGSASFSSFAVMHCRCLKQNADPIGIGEFSLLNVSRVFSGIVVIFGALLPT